MYEGNRIHCSIFTGNYIKGPCEDHDTVRSTTCQYIMLVVQYLASADVQIKIALDATKTEYITLSTAAKYVLLSRELNAKIELVINIPDGEL